MGVCDRCGDRLDGCWCVRCQREAIVLPERVGYVSTVGGAYILFMLGCLAVVAFAHLMQVR